jgi:tetratricopeptide (TPR) repeat protein
MDPDNPNSYLARAFVLLQVGQYEKALADFEKTLELDPQRYDAMRGQGKCLSMLGRDYLAMASFQKLRRAFPDDPDVYYEIADVLFASGYLDECEKACRQCLQLDSGYVSAYVILGMIAMRRNDDDKARRLLNHAVEMEPDNPFALNELSYLTHLDGDEDRAIELVDRAIAESPDYADALCNKGVIHYFRSEFEQASQVFEQTLRLMPDHVGALVGKGNTLVQLNDFDDAQQCYDLALEIDPDNVDACHGKIMLYRMLGLDDEVRFWQDRAARLEGEDGEE